MNYGWIPDLPDHRDHKFSVPREILTSLPSRFDLSDKLPPVWDQGKLGSCTWHAVPAGIVAAQVLQGVDWVMPSRLFGYYITRELMGTTESDSGASIRDCMKAANKVGILFPEDKYPYDISKFREHPSQDCYDSAKQDLLVDYQSVFQDLNQLKGALMERPIVFGFTVYSSFESPMVQRTGIVPFPTWQDSVVGGHAVVLTAFDDSTNMFKFRNSYGPGWGQTGYGLIPYQYVLSNRLAGDFWRINVVPSAVPTPQPQPIPTPVPVPPDPNQIVRAIISLPADLSAGTYKVVSF